MIEGLDDAKLHAIRAIEAALASVGEKPGVGGGRQFTPPGEIDQPIAPLISQENAFQITSMPRSGDLTEGVGVRV